MLFLRRSHLDETNQALYLWLMHGKTIIVSKASGLEVLARAREHRPLLRRQMVYFGSILAVVVSFRI